MTGFAMENSYGIMYEGNWNMYSESLEFAYVFSHRTDI